MVQIHVILMNNFEECGLEGKSGLIWVYHGHKMWILRSRFRKLAKFMKSISKPICNSLRKENISISCCTSHKAGVFATKLSTKAIKSRLISFNVVWSNLSNLASSWGDNPSRKTWLNWFGWPYFPIWHKTQFYIAKKGSIVLAF